MTIDSKYTAAAAKQKIPINGYMPTRQATPSPQDVPDDAAMFIAHQEPRSDSVHFRLVDDEIIATDDVDVAVWPNRHGKLLLAPDGTTYMFDARFARVLDWMMADDALDARRVGRKTPARAGLALVYATHDDGYSATFVVDLATDEVLEVFGYTTSHVVAACFTRRGLVVIASDNDEPLIATLPLVIDDEDDDCADVGTAHDWGVPDINDLIVDDDIYYAVTPTTIIRGTIAGPRHVHARPTLEGGRRLPLMFNPDGPGIIDVAMSRDDCRADIL